jgi:hypothetical protein
MYRPEREPKLIGQAAKFCAIDVTRSHPAAAAPLGSADGATVVSLDEPPAVTP